jgi:hypothetical protein
MKVFALLALLLLQLRTPATRQEGAVITGRIEVPRGRSVEGLRVFAATAEPASQPGNTTIVAVGNAGKDGQFRLENVPPGRYVIMAGLLEAPTYFPGVSALTEAIAITADPGRTVSGIDFAALIQSIGVNVSGHVTPIPANTPAGAFRVTLRRLISNGASLGSGDLGTAAVQPDGSFSFARVTAGTYSLSVTPGTTFGEPSTFVVGTDDVTGLSIPISPVALGRVLVEGSSGNVREWVRAVEAQSLAGDPSQQRVTIFWNDALASATARETTFLIAGLTKGDYQIIPTLTVGATLRSMMVGSVDLTKSPLTIPQEGPPREMEIRIVVNTNPTTSSPGVTVSGTLFEIPAQTTTPRRISIESLALIAAGKLSDVPLFVGQAPVEDDGTFEIRGTPPGVYTVTCAGSCPPNIKEVVTIAERPVHLDLRPRPDLNVFRNPQLIPRVSAGHSIQGKVIVRGNARAEAVALFGADDRTLTTQINADGTFLFANVPPGAYDLAPLPLNLTPGFTRLVVRDADLRDVRIEAQPARVARGHVVADRTGVTPQFVNIKLGLQSATGIVWIAVQPDGSFSGEIPPGEYRAVVENLPDGFTVASVMYDGVDLTRTPLKTDVPLDQEIRLNLAPGR